MMSPALGFLDRISRVAADAMSRVAAGRVADQAATMTRASRMRGARLMAETADV